MLTGQGKCGSAAIGFYAGNSGTTCKCFIVLNCSCLSCILVLMPGMPEHIIDMQICVENGGDGPIGVALRVKGSRYAFVGMG